MKLSIEPFLLAVLLGSVACTSRPVAHVSASVEAPAPRSIALLPPSGEIDGPVRDALRRILATTLRERRHRLFDEELVDERLARAGYEPWKASWLPDDAALAAFARSLEVDAIVVADRFSEIGFSAGVVFRRGLSVRLRLIDARGTTLRSVEASADEMGGLLLDGGQVIRAVRETIDAGREERLSFAATDLGLKAASLIPEGAREGAARLRPDVRDVRIGARRASRFSGGDALVPGDVIAIEVSGTPGGRACAAIAGVVRALPLSEISPGVYRGELRLEPGSGEGAGPAVASITDAFGASSERRQSGDRVAIAAPRGANGDARPAAVAYAAPK